MKIKELTVAEIIEILKQVPSDKKIYYQASDEDGGSYFKYLTKIRIDCDGEVEIW